MQLNNLKVNFLGDSITYGYGVTSAEKTFHQIIKREFGLNTANNYGVSGTRIAKQTIHDEYDNYFALRAKNMNPNTDLIVVFGGTNDFGHGDSKMGDIHSTDICTFYGALNVLCSQLKFDFPSAKIVFMTPIRRTTENTPNHNGKVLADYVDAIITVAKKHNLPYIDLFRSGIIDPFDSKIVPDGLHPNDEGHIIMANYVAKELIKI